MSNDDAERETEAVLEDFPDILERVRRLEAGEGRLIPWKEVAAQLEIRLKDLEEGEK